MKTNSLKFKILVMTILTIVAIASIAAAIPYSLQMFRGLSSDEKPTDSLMGSQYYEIDTHKIFTLIGTSWEQTYPASAGSVLWGNITGTLSSQTDLQSVLDGKLSSFTELDPVFGNSVAYGINSEDISNWNGKLSSITGSALDNVFSTNGLLKRTGAGTYAIDDSTYLTSYTETDPIVKAINGVIKSNGITITAAESSDLISTLGFTPENSSNKGVASGYAGLDASSKVPTTNLGGSGADNSKFLRGDQTWATPTASAVWGGITGTLSDQSDLNTALSGKQSSHTNLTSLSGLSYSSTAFVKMTGTNTFTLDTATYLTGNQSITLGGILSGSGTTSITVSAATGYYMPSTSDQTNWDGKLSAVTGTALDNVFTTNGFLKRTGAGTYITDSSTYLTGNQSITLSGDASGSGATSISVTNTGLRGVTLPTLSTGYLYYNGSSFAFQTPSSGGLDPIATITLWDDFISGLLTTGNIGDLGWGLTGTAPTVIASVANHNGIRQIPTTTTSGNISAIWLGGAVNTDTVLYNNYCDMTFIVRMTDTTTDTAFVGAMDAMGTAVGNQDRYGFEYIDSTDTYWMMVTGNGSSSTRTATNITVSPNTWYKLRIVRDGSGVNYYIDGISTGSVTTTLPDTSMNIGYHIQTNTTVAKYIQVDLFNMTLGVTR